MNISDLSTLLYKFLHLFYVSFFFGSLCTIFSVISADPSSILMVYLLALSNQLFKLATEFKISILILSFPEVVFGFFKFA